MFSGIERQIVGMINRQWSGYFYNCERIQLHLDDLALVHDPVKQSEIRISAVGARALKRIVMIQFLTRFCSEIKSRAALLK